MRLSQGGGVLIAAAALAVSACAQQTLTTRQPSSALGAHAAARSGSRVPKRLLYVTDNNFNGESSITYYALDASGNAEPAGAIEGSNTKLNGPNGIVLDSNGEIYVSNSSGSDILGFPPGSNGDVAPIAVITTSTLQQPIGLAIDPKDNLYAADCGAFCTGSSGTDNVSIFPPGSNGNATPSAVIAGPDTQMYGVSAVALDTRGNIYVTSRGSNAILVFAPGSNGDVAPIDVIAGAKTQLDGPNGISVSRDGHIFTGLNSQAIAVYHPIPYPQSNVPPDRLITGSKTGLSNPDDPVISPDGEIIVSNRYSNSVARFAGRANGNVAPLSSLAGGDTQLVYPAYLFVSVPRPSPSPSPGR